MTIMTTTTNDDDDEWMNESGSPTVSMQLKKDSPAPHWLRTDAGQAVPAVHYGDKTEAAGLGSLALCPLNSEGRCLR